MPFRFLFFFFLRQTIVGGGAAKITKFAPPLPPPVPLTNQSAIKDARPIHIPSIKVLTTWIEISWGDICI